MHSPNSTALAFTNVRWHLLSIGSCLKTPMHTARPSSWSSFVGYALSVSFVERPPFLVSLWFKWVTTRYDNGREHNLPNQEEYQAAVPSPHSLIPVRQYFVL